MPATISFVAEPGLSKALGEVAAKTGLHQSKHQSKSEYFKGPGFAGLFCSEPSSNFQAPELINNVLFICCKASYLLFLTSCRIYPTKSFVM